MAATVQLQSDNTLGKRKRSADSHHRDEASEDERDLENYFAAYVPLSNLPTPPAPKMPAGRPLTPPLEAEGVDVHDPVHYLSNLIPQGASLHRLPASTIATYLRRSALPQSTVALAACIIDSLSSFFVRTWRKECAVISSAQQGQSMFAISQTQRQQMYGTATPKSALIVLAALSIAAGFLDDVKTGTKWWVRRVARGDLSPREMDTTVRCMLKDIDYDLLSFTPDVVEDMRQEMFSCADSDSSYFSSTPSCDNGISYDAQPSLLQLDCKPATKGSIVKEGLLTPELSPMSAAYVEPLQQG